MFPWRKPSSAARIKDAPASNPGEPLSDAALVHAARAGDKRAFVEIVARHQGMVCGVALGVLADFAASEDAAQEAFLTAWRKIDELREPERLRAWLAQIARNAALAHLRRSRRHDELDEALAIADEGPSPIESVANEEEFALVRDFLAKLPETYRLPLVLFYREGQSVRSVADTLGISEDAVKQRLARGREMLRDRMSGMVETVLAQTRPSPAFTIAIAAAIGALAAPAAIASVAFSAATAATAGTATTSFVTVMSTSKATLAAAAVVAVVCIPVGYYAASPGGAEGNGSIATMQATATIGTTNRQPSFENSALFAEWRQLHEEHGSSADSMPRIYRAISEFKDPVRRRAFRAALLAEWVQVDAMGAFKALSGKSGDASQRRQFFDEWLAHDPVTAVDALLAGLSGWESVARDSLKEIARRVPARIPELAQRLPKSSSYWDNSVREAFAIISAQDLTSARKAAEGLTGPNREQALAGVAQAWGQRDLTAATDWAKSLPAGIDHNEVIRGALMGQAAVNPAAALDLGGSVPPGGRDGYFATTTGARVLNRAAEANYDATVQWLAANPGRLGREDMMGIAAAVSSRLMHDPVAFLNRHADDGSLKVLMPAIESALLNDAANQRAAVWEWAKAQGNDVSTQELRDFVLRSAAWQEPSLALKLAGEAPRTKEGDAQLDDVARHLWNGGQNLNQFNKLYEQAPERLRPAIADSAFTYLDKERMADPQTWVTRLALVPEGKRDQHTIQLARAWAGQSPEQAVGWVQTFSPGQTRAEAVAAIAGAWATQDPSSAATWVAAMSPGNERDRSAGSLATGLVNRYPSQALDWALSIDDLQMRNMTALQVLLQVKARDADAARRLIQAAAAPPATKAFLDKVLSTQPRQ